MPWNPRRGRYVRGSLPAGNRASQRVSDPVRARTNSIVLRRAASPPPASIGCARAAPLCARGLRAPRCGAVGGARAQLPPPGVGGEPREPLRSALEAFERLGAEPWAERARAELGASGETARRRDPSAANQLNPPELQVGVGV